jgi:Fe-S cluster assembly protein SufD
VRHLSVKGASGDPVLKCPRSLIVLEEGAQATVAERFSARAGETYLTNAMTEIVVGDNARVAHYAINRESRNAWHVNSRNIEIGAGAHVESHAVILGGAITRNNVTPTFIGRDADAILNGVYLAGASQHVDNHMRVHHNAEHCRSRQFYKGLLTDDGRAVFTGRIVVARAAQKTDAIQSNANLLLSKNARANSRPQLEIYADDVRCTHGATVGELDENAMFYLRARGLPENTARAILVAAFARENIDRMGLEPVREWLTKRVLERLPDTDLLLPAD